MSEIDAAVQRALLGNGQAPAPQPEIPWIELQTGVNEDGDPVMQRFPAPVAAVMVGMETLNVLRQILAALQQ